MLYWIPWTVFGDNIKGLNSKCDDDGSCILQYLSDKSYGLMVQPMNGGFIH